MKRYLKKRYVYPLILVVLIVTLLTVAIFPNNHASFPPSYTNKILIINLDTNTTDPETTDRSLLTTVKGLGFNYDITSIHDVESIDLTSYDAIIVSQLDRLESGLNKREEMAIKAAIDKGTNFLWIGIGIEGYDGETIPSAFGIKFIQNLERHNASYAEWNGHKILLYEEGIVRVDPKAATVESYFYDQKGAKLSPAITYYQKNFKSGKAVYVAYENDNYWNENPENKGSWDRAYVLTYYLQRIIRKPHAVLNPYPSNYKSVVLVRIEDISTQTSNDYIKRLNDTVYWLGSHNIPLNLGIIPVYINGSAKANKTENWRKDLSSDEMVNLKKVLDDAIYKFNGDIITHGYGHQNGSGFDDYSGRDYEFWDEDYQHWLPYLEQFDRIKKAKEEIQMEFPQINLTTVNIDYKCKTNGVTDCWVNNTNPYTASFTLDSQYYKYPGLLTIRWYYSKPNIRINGKDLDTSWWKKQASDIYIAKTVHVTSDYFIAGVNNMTIDTDASDGAQIDYINITFIKGYNSTAFEPPHYFANNDTYRAAWEAGYRYDSESDEAVFPNNLSAPPLINIPETGGYIPSDATQQNIDNRTSQFETIYNVSGVYLIFYHVFTDEMHEAFKSIIRNILAHERVWYPNISEFARWWENKDSVVFDSVRDENNKTMVVNISGPIGLENVTVKFILPTTVDVANVSLDGSRINYTTEIVDAYSRFIYVVIPSLSKNNIILYWFDNKSTTTLGQKEEELKNPSHILTILAFDSAGNQLNYNEFDRANLALSVTTIEDNAVSSKPWLKNIDEKPAIEWKSQEPIKISIAWELPDLGYSTIYLDNEGKGYGSSETINFNFEALKTQWKFFNVSYNMRINAGFPYIPSDEFIKLRNEAQRFVKMAYAASDESERGIYSNKGLDTITQAWDIMLKEYGMQFGKKFYNPETFWFGVTIANAEDDQEGNPLDNYKWKLDEAKKQGNDWVRILFEEAEANEDFTFSNKETFKKYDEVINYARSIGLNVMGQILDSSMWSKDITVEKYRLRTRNLVIHYQGKISAWEIGNEINGNWLVKQKNLNSDDLIIDSVNAAANEVKRINSSLKTVTTLYWSEGTADYEHSLFFWVNKWKTKKNFGTNIDVIALSVYPAFNPVGSAFDIMIQRLHEKFPDKKIMIGEFDYNEGVGYWWHSENVSEARKDLVALYYTAMMGYDYSMNGGFWWYFYDEMIKDGKESELYYELKNTIELFK